MNFNFFLKMEILQQQEKTTKLLTFRLLHRLPLYLEHKNYLDFNSHLKPFLILKLFFYYKNLF